MAGSYRISAIPQLYSKGNFVGKLQGASFTAVSPTETREWFTNNCGQFELEFSKIMPLPIARILVASLKRGDEVDLPGLYADRQFACGFIFEWPVADFQDPMRFARDRAF